MKKNKLSIFLVFIFGLLIFNTDIAYANEIVSIDVDVEILDDGTGKINQEWNTYVDEGTEFFIPISNLNHMELENLKVANQTRDFEFEPNWDVDKSFEEKAYKYGIIETDDGMELCFGMSEKGDQTYNISFDYKNMVQSFTDADGFNVRFVNNKMDPAPERVNLTITSSKMDFNEENSKIWAFGYGGNINFEEGKIIAKSTEKFDSSNHLTALVRIEKGYLLPSYQSQDSFERLKEEAFVGSSYSSGDPEYENSNSEANIEKIAKWPIFAIFGGFVSILAFILTLVNNLNPRFNISAEDTMGKGPRIVDRKPPLNGNLEANYYFLSSLNPSNKDFNFNLFTAYLARWIADGNINEEYNIITKPNLVDNSFAMKLWKFIVEKSVIRNKIDIDKLEQVIVNEYDIFMVLFNQALNDGKDFAIENQLINRENTFLFLKKNKLTEKGKGELIKVNNLKSYFTNISLNNNELTLDKSSSKEFFILSLLYGIREEFIADIEKNENFYSGGFWYSPYRHIYHSTSRVRSTVEDAYVTGVNNASSGSGGSSSFGGGGGFSGGGSGGGAR